MADDTKAADPWEARLDAVALSRAKELWPTADRKQQAERAQYMKEAALTAANSQRGTTARNRNRVAVTQLNAAADRMKRQRSGGTYVDTRESYERQYEDAKFALEQANAVLAKYPNGVGRLGTPEQREEYEDARREKKKWEPVVKRLGAYLGTAENGRKATNAGTTNASGDSSLAGNPLVEDADAKRDAVKRSPDATRQDVQAAERGVQNAASAANGMTREQQQSQVAAQNAGTGGTAAPSAGGGGAASAKPGASGTAQAAPAPAKKTGGGTSNVRALFKSKYPRYWGSIVAQCKAAGQDPEAVLSDAIAVARRVETRNSAKRDGRDALRVLQEKYKMTDISGSGRSDYGLLRALRWCVRKANYGGIEGATSTPAAGGTTGGTKGNAPDSPGNNEAPKMGNALVKINGRWYQALANGFYVDDKTGKKYRRDSSGGHSGVGHRVEGGEHYILYAPDGKWYPELIGEVEGPDPGSPGSGNDAVGAERTDTLPDAPAGKRITPSGPAAEVDIPETRPDAISAAQPQDGKGTVSDARVKGAVRYSRGNDGLWHPEL